MKNYIQPGNIVTLTTGTYEVKAGDLFQRGGFIGVVVADASFSSDVEVAIVGVFELKKAAVQFDEGEKVYWDPLAADGAGRCTTTDTETVLLGLATEGAATNDATVRVRFSGVPLY
jgi:predicted RecA/RadA family phage recombinase